MIKKGSTDMPAKEDQFEIKKYVEGLISFIKECNTPMTLAIQGDWGTGKTSIMTMVKSKLQEDSKDKIECVWFNTWQFSQFNMGEQLPLLMMSKLVSSVSNGKGEITDTLKKIFTGIAGLATGYVSGGASNGEDIQKLFESDFVKQVDELKTAFQNMVRERAGAEGRVVVFIDDLDRLQPGRAVELLEVLKVFLDCEQCVFVLAIDYGVVCRGVKEKYGEDFSDEKGKSFFDKIIQVPFKMPIAEYNIQNYICEEFKNIGLDVSEKELPIYQSLINSSIGNNPRGMKRLFNSFLLLKYVADESIFQNSHYMAILFALLCMQSRYESVYNYLIEKKSEINESMISQLEREDEQLMKNLKLTAMDEEDFSVFIEDFVDVIDSEHGNTYSVEGIEAFKKVLSFSAITANNAKGSSNEFGEYRWRHKDFCRKVKELLNDYYNGSNITFNDWHNRNDKGTWWTYFRNEGEDCKLEFGYEFRLDPKPSDSGMKSSMTVTIYPVKKSTPLSRILEEMGGNPYSELGYEGEVGNTDRIWYNNLLTFDTTDESSYEEIFVIAKKTVDALLKYTN